MGRLGRFFGRTNVDECTNATALHSDATPDLPSGAFSAAVTLHHHTGGTQPDGLFESFSVDRLISAATMQEARNACLGSQRRPTRFASSTQLHSGTRSIAGPQSHPLHLTSTLLNTLSAFPNDVLLPRSERASATSCRSEAKYKTGDAVTDGIAGSAMALSVQQLAVDQALIAELARFEMAAPQEEVAWMLIHGIDVQDVV